MVVLCDYKQQKVVCHAVYNFSLDLSLKQHIIVI